MTRPPLTVTSLALVAAGGALGAALRWSLSAVLPDGSGFPWTTFAINVAGSFLLALLPVLVSRRALIVLLGPGLLGGFTTLSAYAEQGRNLMADGDTGLAAAYVLGTLAACLLAIQLTHLVTTPRQRRRFQTQEGNE